MLIPDDNVDRLLQNPGSKTGYVPAWNTKKIVIKMNSKAILKQTILSKSVEKIFE